MERSPALSIGRDIRFPDLTQISVDTRYQIHSEFGLLFAMKVATFAQELLSVVLTPFILWFTLPRCAPEIIEFFREFTVHVDGLGHVCSFAVFNFERHGNVNVTTSS